MSRRRHRKPRWAGLVEDLKSTLFSISADPKAYALLGGLGLFLCWVVITKSLPYALAPSLPDIALDLNPNNPVALMVKAELVRQQILKLSEAG